MTLDRMIGVKWQPEKVSEVQWECAGRQIELKYPNGILAKLCELCELRSTVLKTRVEGQKGMVN